MRFFEDNLASLGRGLDQLCEQIADRAHRPSRPLDSLRRLTAAARDRARQSALDLKAAALRARESTASADRLQPRAAVVLVIAGLGLGVLLPRLPAMFHQTPKLSDHERELLRSVTRPTDPAISHLSRTVAGNQTPSPQAPRRNETPGVEEPTDEPNLN